MPGDGMKDPTAVAEHGVTRIERIHRLVEGLIQHKRAFLRHEQLAVRVGAAHEQTVVLRQETSALQTRRASEAQVRGELREAIQEEVRRLRAEALPPEKIVIAIKHLLHTAVEEGGLVEPRDFLRHDVFEWMLEAMYAA
jgi:hypothetical protein